MYADNSWITQLHYGDVVLIEARELNIEERARAQKSVQWFYEEVEFLKHEYMAREKAAADLLGDKAVAETRSRIVKLRVGRKTRDAAGDRVRNGSLKARSMKLKLRMRRDMSAIL